MFVFGNSDGDKEMLEWTAAGSGARFMGLVHHTDAVREWAYDRNSPVGRLDKAWDEAVRRGRTVVDMKRDWKKSVSVRPLNGRGSIRPTAYRDYGPSVGSQKVSPARTARRSRPPCRNLNVTDALMSSEPPGSASFGTTRCIQLIYARGVSARTRLRRRDAGHEAGRPGDQR